MTVKLTHDFYANYSNEKPTYKKGDIIEGEKVSLWGSDFIVPKGTNYNVPLSITIPFKNHTPELLQPPKVWYLIGAAAVVLIVIVAAR